MLKKILSILALVIIVFVALGVYVYMFGMASPHPDSKDSVNLTLNDFENTIEVDKSSVNEISTNESLIEQKLLISKQEEIIKVNQKKIEDKIDREIKRLEANFQKNISKKKQEYDKKLENYIEEKKQEYKERVMAKREFYTKKLEKIVNELRKEKEIEIEEKISQVSNEYYNQILNVKLKLDLLDLSKAEKNNLEEKLQQLIKDMEEEKELKREKIEEELNQSIKTAEEKIHEEFKVSEENIKEEINKAINNKNKELEIELGLYIEKEEKLLVNKIKEKKTILHNRGEELIDQQKKIISLAQKDFYKLEGNQKIDLDKLEGESP